MFIADSMAALARVVNEPTDPALTRLLKLRLEQLGNGMKDTARFLIVEPPDTLADVETAIGFPLATDEAPSWEWLEHHDGGWIEIVFILSDDAPADVLLVPARSDIGADLIAVIRQHAPWDDQPIGTVTA